jgi:hypothetical protein
VLSLGRLLLALLELLRGLWPRLFRLRFLRHHCFVVFFVFTFFIIIFSFINVFFVAFFVFVVFVIFFSVFFILFFFFFIVFFFIFVFFFIVVDGIRSFKDRS